MLHRTTAYAALALLVTATSFAQDDPAASGVSDINTYETKLAA